MFTPCPAAVSLEARWKTAAAGNGPFMSDLGWSLAGLAARARSQEAAAIRWSMSAGAGGLRRAVAGRFNASRSARDNRRAARPQLSVALLTGDIAPAAQRVAAAIGIDDVGGTVAGGQARCLDRRRRDHKVVAMVGDGLNDGLVLGGSRCWYCRRVSHRSRPRNRGNRVAKKRILDAALGRRCGPGRSQDDSHQPHVGFRLQYHCAEPGGSWRFAADPRGSGHGRIERPRGGEFAAAGATAGPSTPLPPRRSTRERLGPRLSAELGPAIEPS